MPEKQSEKNKKSFFWAVLAFLLLIFFAVLFVIKNSKEQQLTFGQEQTAEPNPVSFDSNEPNAPEQADSNDTKFLRPDHNHPAFSERIDERSDMVLYQIKARGITDSNTIKAMKTVPRHAFVRPGERALAYFDTALPIAEGQTISQPYVVAFMTEALKLTPESRVLEIGTGSGYQAAVCAGIAREVYSIEIVEPLAQRAKKLLKELGYNNVFVRAGDGYFGWPEKAPFDAVIGTAAAERIPEPLIEQLKPRGIMILPYEIGAGFQYLVVVTKDEKGNIHKENVLPVRFVPMTGEVQKKK